MKTTMNTPAPFVPEGMTITTLSSNINWKGHACTDYNNKPTGKYHPTFEFTVELTMDGRHMQTPYSGGSLAFLTPEVKRQIRESKDRDATHAIGYMDGFKRVRGIDIDGSIAVKYIFARSAIKPLDVLYSLVSDARAGTETFDDFCSNYGYDTDSRKAYATWQQCQTGAREFLRVLGSSDLLTRLEEAFQDY